MSNTSEGKLEAELKKLSEELNKLTTELNNRTIDLNNLTTDLKRSKYVGGVGIVVALMLAALIKVSPGLIEGWQVVAVLLGLIISVTCVTVVALCRKGEDD